MKDIVNIRKEKGGKEIW